MRHLLCSLALLGLFASLATAEEIAARNGATVSTSGGEITIRFPDKKGDWPPAIGVPERTSAVAGKKITLSFEAKSTEPMSARIVISEFAPPYTHLAGAETVKLTTGWDKYSLTFTVGSTTADKVNAPLFAFDEFPTSGQVHVRNIKITPAN